MASQWFYEIAGKQGGPVTSAELLALAQRGTVLHDTPVRKGPDGKWVSAKRVGGLFPEANATSPSTPTAATEQCQKQTADALPQKPSQPLASDVYIVSTAPVSEEPSQVQPVPPFNTYYPNIDGAGAEQRAFYKWLSGELEKGKTPNVQGNLSYLFVRIYELVGDFIQTRNYAALAKWFDFLRAGYAEVPKIGGYLDTWQGDAALLIQNWEDAWKYKRRNDLDMDLIVNVNRHVSSTTLAAHDLHVLLHSDDGLTEWGRQHFDVVDREGDRLLSHFRGVNNRDFLDMFFEQYAWRELGDADLAKIADDCEYLVSAQRLKNLYYKYPRQEEVERPLFAGVLMPWETTTNPPTKVGNGMAISITTHMRVANPTLSMVRLSPAIQLAAVALCKRLLREAENNARDGEGLPRIGEGWISETELFNIIRSAFPAVSVIQHARPEWLSPQHLDVYLPEYSIGIEFQGAQHLSPVDYFGGEKAFAQQRKRDARKKRLCAKNKCVLLEVFQGYSSDDVVGKVRSLAAQKME